MTMNEFEKLYSRMCAAYSVEPNQAQKMEYFASLKDWSIDRLNQVFEEIKQVYVWFPKVAEFKKVYAIIRENELRQSAPPPKTYEAAPDQDAINERGLMLIYFQLYQNAKQGKGTLGISKGEILGAMHHLHKKGYWSHWSKTLNRSYPNKSKIDEMAAKEKLSQAI